MKKRLPFWILSIFLICHVIAVPVSAHPGRTDNNGGHTDHGSGEYHYHHGYEAHAHYDIDMDGDIDCPYDFDDQTNHNSSNSTDSGSTRTQGLTFNDGYESGYDKGYDDGYQAGQEYIESAKDASYESGYKDGEAAAMEALEPTIKERVKETITSWIAIGIFSIIFVIYPAWFILTGLFGLLCDWLKARKKAKSKPETAKSMPQEKLIPSQPLNSSFIAKLEYRNSMLILTFVNGDVYTYYNVEESVYQEMLSAPSKGKFFHERIKDKYPYK